MTEILLKELSNADIGWLMQNGKHQRLEMDDLLIQADQTDFFYILLSGSLAVCLPHSGREFIHLSDGEIAGAIPFLHLSAAPIKAKVSSEMLVIPRSLLTQKLEQDAEFAAHFYRACAIILANRLKQLSKTLNCHSAILMQMQLKEAEMVFAELQDADLDWLIAVGKVQQFASETVVLDSGSPVDQLHILLDGAMSLSLTEKHNTLIAKVFSEATGEAEQEFARLSRGELLGELVFVDAHSIAVKVRTLRDSQVLSIPRWRLAAKLLHDAGFAARFYKVLAALLANKQQAIAQKLGGSTEELGGHFLAQMALAEARFDWMLKRIQTQKGSEIQW
jgi:bacteriocin-type transport-associated protein